MVKVISLSNEAYEKLKKIKRDKSFSEVVINLVERKKKKKDWRDFVGVWKKNSDRWEKVKKELAEDRKKFKTRGYKW